MSPLLQAPSAPGGARRETAQSLPALCALDGYLLGPYHLELAEVSPRGYVEQVNFALALVDGQGQRATPLLFAGTYSRGRPASGIAGWIDGIYCSPLAFPGGKRIDLAEDGLDRAFFARLGELIPPNGRLMLAYETFRADTPLLRQTREALSRGIPPLATPIGELLFHADCWLGVRDWYIPEGGREGHRKLQGNKALDPGHRRQRTREALEQLFRFLLKRTAPIADTTTWVSRQRALKLIGELRNSPAVAQVIST